MSFREGFAMRFVFWSGFSVCLAFAVLIFFPWPKLDAEQVLDYYLDPTPEGTEVEVLSYFNPSLGDGVMLLELVLTDRGMEEILGRFSWMELGPAEAHLLHSHDRIESIEESVMLGFDPSESTRIEILIIDQNRLILAALI